MSAVSVPKLSTTPGVDEEEATTTLLMVDKLQDMGINAGDIAKLKTAGIFTFVFCVCCVGAWLTSLCRVSGILMQTKKDLCNVKGLSEAKVDKVLEAAGKLHMSGFITASELLVKRQDVVRVTTGSSDLDKLLGGGIESQSITEIFGEFRTGKTQLCHTLCVTGQLPVEAGGGNGKVCFIDTEGTFRPERIGPIAERFNADPEQVLENITYARPHTHEQQIEILADVAARMAEDPYSLLIMDSAMALFRVDFSGRGELAERQQKLGRMLNRLMKIADEFNVAVVITNQVCADPGASAMFVSDPKKPVGGHIIAHASTTRLFLRKGKGDQRICKVYDSPSIPESEATFQLSNGGITDAKD